MNALDTLFPSIPTVICRWHLNNNVKAHCRRTYRMKRNLHYDSVRADNNDNPQWIDKPETLKAKVFYYQAINSNTEVDFEATCRLMTEKHLLIASYMEKNWWPYKEKCVNAWTNRYRHFGELSTSRVEE